MRIKNMTQGFTESVVEDAAFAWLESLSWRVTHGPEIAPGEARTARLFRKEL